MDRHAPLLAYEVQAPIPGQEDDEIHWNMLHSVRRLYQGRRLVLLSAVAGALVGALLAFAIPPWYSATAVFLPPKNADQLVPTPNVLFGANDTSDLYLGMLTSASVADDVIDHVGLIPVYKAQKRVDAHVALATASSFSLSKNSLIDVTVKAKTPELAAAIANAYLDALYRLNGQMVSSGSVYRRVFYEQQLEEQRRALADAETELKQTQEHTGVVLPQGEAQAGINATAQLQSQIGLAEARLAGLLTGATERNPEVVAARNELAQLRAELASQRAAGASHGGLASTSRMPGLALEVEQKTREVKLRQTTYELLVAQYEKARLSSIDPGPQLQIVDRAKPPERKAGPTRKLFVGIGLVLGLLGGMLYLLAAEPLRLFARTLRQPIAGDKG